MVTQFDEDTRLRREDDGVWRGRLSDRWHIGKIPNGGYVMAVATKAMMADLPHPDPINITGYYLDRSEAGDVEVSVELVRAGRSTSIGEAKVIQGGKERARFTAILGELASADGLTDLLEGPPELLDPDDCPKMPFIEGLTPEMMRRFDFRLSPDSTDWMMGREGSHATLGGWARFADGREPDLLSLALFADCLPPAVFNRIGPTGWVPTLELSVQLRAHPAPGWLLCWFTTRYVTNGYLEEDGQIWDSEGNLVAISRQLARILPKRRR